MWDDFGFDATSDFGGNMADWTSTANDMGWQDWSLGDTGWNFDAPDFGGTMDWWSDTPTGGYGFDAMGDMYGAGTEVGNLGGNWANTMTMPSSGGWDLGGMFGGKFGDALLGMAGKAIPALLTSMMGGGRASGSASANTGMTDMFGYGRRAPYADQLDRFYQDPMSLPALQSIQNSTMEALRRKAAVTGQSFNDNALATNLGTAMMEQSLPWGKELANVAGANFPLQRNPAAEAAITADYKNRDALMQTLGSLGKDAFDMIREGISGRSPTPQVSPVVVQLVAKQLGISVEAAAQLVQAMNQQQR